MERRKFLRALVTGATAVWAAPTLKSLSWILPQKPPIPFKQIYGRIQLYPDIWVCSPSMKNAYLALLETETKSLIEDIAYRGDMPVVWDATFPVRPVSDSEYTADADPSLFSVLERSRDSFWRSTR